MSHLRYIAHYPTQVKAQVTELLTTERLGDWLKQRHGTPHNFRANHQLFELGQTLKNQFLRKAPPLHHIAYSDKVLRSHDALGVNVKKTRSHGKKQPIRREILVDTLFKGLSEPLLRMILAHEIAHIKEQEHNKSFYSLCCHIEPQYHQLELELRLILVYRDYYNSLPF
ncbi:MAG: YgjP-like metallopeptidase domain-containing protein [Pontibacterium sp.]